MKSVRFAALLSCSAFVAHLFGQAPPPSAPEPVRQRVVSAPAHRPGPEVLPHNYQIGVTMTAPGKPPAELSVVVAQPDTAFKVDLHEAQDEKDDGPTGGALFGGTMRIEADGTVFLSYAISREFPVLVATRGDVAMAEARGQRNY